MEIRWYAEILQRRKWLVVLTTFMAVAVAGLGSYLMTPVYSASTMVRIAQMQDDWIDYEDLNYSMRLMNTYVRLLRSGPFLEEVIQRLDLNTLPQELAKRIKVEALSETELLKITAESPGPRQAMEMANMLGTVLIEQGQKVYSGEGKTAREMLQEQLTIVEQNLAEDRELLQSLINDSNSEHQSVRIQDLNTRIRSQEETYAMLVHEYNRAQVGEEIRANSISIVEPATTPKAPSKPRIKLNMTLGALVGLVGAVGLAFFVENLDPTLYSRRESEAVAKNPALVSMASFQVELAERETAVEDLKAQLREREGEVEALRVQMMERGSTIDSFQGELAEREAAVGDLKAQLSEKEGEVEALRGQMMERDDIMASFQGELAEKEAAVGDLKVQLREKDEEFEALRAEVLERGNLIGSLQGELAEREGAVEDLKVQLRGKDEELEALRAEVLERGNLIGSFQAELAERETAVEDLRVQLSEKEGEVEALRVQMMERDGTIDSIQAELAEREGAVEDLKAQLREKEGEVEALRVQMIERDDIIDSFQAELAERETAVEDLKAQLREKEGEVEALRVQMMERGSTIDSFQGELAEREAAVGDLKAQLSEKEGEVEALRVQMMERDGTIDSFQAELAEREATVGDLEAQLSEREGEFEALRAEVLERGNLIGSLQGELAEREGAVEDLKVQLRGKDEELEALRAEVLERGNLIGSLQGELAEREGAVEDLKVQLRGKDEELEALRVQMIERDDIIDSFQAELAERETAVEDLKVQLSEREGEVEALRAEVLERGNLIGSFQAELTEREAAVRDLKARLRRSRRWVTVLDLDVRSSAGEAYQILNTNFSSLSSRIPKKILLITSVESGVGKSRLLANLAVGMAQAGQRVVVVDGNFRRPSLHQVFDLSNDLGLSDVILGRSRVDTALQETEIPGLRVLTSGPLPPNPAEPLDSARMQELVWQLATVADMVLLDSPPVLEAADAAVLAPIVDGVLVVADRDQATGGHIQRALEEIDKVGAKALGLVFDRTGAHGGEYCPRYRHVTASAESVPEFGLK